MVYVDNLVQGVVRAELSDTPPGRGWWIADERPYEMREIVATVKAALREAGLDVADRQTRLPAVVGRLAERADALVQRTGRYVTQLHVLGEMDKTIACDISVAKAESRLLPHRRPGRRHASQHRLVPRARDRAVIRVLVTGGNGYFGSLLVERLVAAGDDVRVLDIDPTGQQPDGVDVVVADIRDAGRCGRQWTGSTSCTTTSLRCRSPRTRRCSAR